MSKKKRAILLLEDGTAYHGWSFGCNIQKPGEVVFNTASTGYEEIITDPSYSGQIVVMCYPHIGNYGINLEDGESYKIWLEGLVVREYSEIFSNQRAKCSLAQYLKKNRIAGIEGVDTRAIVRRLRSKGSMKGIISSCDENIGQLKKRLRNLRSISEQDLVSKVNRSAHSAYKKYKPAPVKKNPDIAVIDFGVKLNIIRSMENAGFNVNVFSGQTDLKKVLECDPAGIVLSNGPGDPRSAAKGVKLAREIIKYNRKKRLPLLGICLGHQLIGLASGARTYKLKFGHHGSNHPVKDLKTGNIEITSQNHNYCVDINTISDDFRVTHINLNDRTVEGIKHKKMPVMSFQYHPEACPGPHDSGYLFKRFGDLVNGKKI